MGEQHKCLKTDTFANLKEDVDLLKSEMKQLQQNNAETRVYVKQILERIESLKDLFKSSQESAYAGISGANKTWQPVVLELIKMIGTIAAVIAGMKLMGV